MCVLYQVIIIGSGSSFVNYLYSPQYLYHNKYI